MGEADRLIVPGRCLPPEHAAAVVVNAVPHHLADEASDLTEALDAIELGHARRCIVADAFADQSASRRVLVVGLARARAEARIIFHPPDQDLEVAVGKIEIEVDLAEVVELVEVNGCETGIKSLDDSWPHRACPAVPAVHDPHAR
jgi:hypothetical protein